MFDDDQERPWLQTLNSEQRAAATHPGGPLLILAGAGTGKTTTLCARVAWLLVEGVPAERILLLTFTRRAAREMIERARALTERVVPNADRVVGGTFHSVAHRMVRTHASSLGRAADRPPRSRHRPWRAIGRSASACARNRNRNRKEAVVSGRRPGAAAARPGQASPAKLS